MRLAELLEGVEVETLTGRPQVAIAEVRDDSRAVQKGDLFVATRGQTVDGHHFLAPAVAQGAAALVVEEALEPAPAGVTQVKVRSSARALAQIAANRWGRPAEAMTLVGITGTNGKTTTSFLAEALVRGAGGTPGVLGTVAYRFVDQVREAPFTTPTPLVLHATLAEMRRAGVSHVVMEASSHALALERLHGLRFAVAAFTNLTQDHLDFHGTMADYAAAKARLFSELLDPAGVGVINLDNEYGAAMQKAVRGRALTVSARQPADVRATRVEHSVAGIVAEVTTPAGPSVIRSPLIGAFNLENLLVGVGIGLGLGLSPATIAAGLATVRGVPGRLERVAGGAGFELFVDYAHTPDALERVMATLRPLTRGRLIVVFGCGGDRDQRKRPLMGRAVAQAADLPIVTSDNPRTESPAAIVEMIVAGVQEVRKEGFLVELDRRKAIGAAVAAARPGDVVLIAGKGHEDYQILGRVKHPFDDRLEAAAALAKLANGPASGQS